MVQLKKRYVFAGIGTISLALSSFIVLSEDKLTRDNLHKDLKVDTPQASMVLKENLVPSFSVLDKDNSFVGFKEKMGYRESRGNYFIVNSFGYMGKYQFGKTALDYYGIENEQDFLNTPELQEKLFRISISHNKWKLRKEITKYVGKKIDGILITESGILAAAHLAGTNSVRQFLKTNGDIGFADANGTSIRNYMKSFQGYDLSHIEADRLNR